MSDAGLRAAINSADLDSVRALLADRPQLATEEIVWDDGYGGDSSAPLNYVSLARFHNLAGHDRMAEIAAALVAAGAPVDGEPDTEETPLITAASYGEAAVATVLIDAGADLEAEGHAAEPGQTALAHATYYGNPEVADLLVAAGAQVRTLAEAAGAGNLGDRLDRQNSPQDLAWALRNAAVCQRLEVIDQLLAAGVDLQVRTEGATALHLAAYHGKLSAVRHLVERGADPNSQDPEHAGTPLSWCRYRRGELYRPSPEHDAVEQYLQGLTTADRS